MTVPDAAKRNSLLDLIVRKVVESIEEDDNDGE